MSNSEIQDLSIKFAKLNSTEFHKRSCKIEKDTKMAFSSEQLKAIIENAVTSVLTAQEEQFDLKFQTIN